MWRQAEADSPRDQPEAVPGSALVPREREGVPVSALVAFSAKGRGKQERIMIAAGWDDGQWSLRQYSDGRAAEVNGGLAEPPEPGLEVTGDTRGSGPVLRIVHQVRLKPLQGWRFNWIHTNCQYNRSNFRSLVFQLL